MPVLSESVGVGGDMRIFNMYCGQILYMAKFENPGLQIFAQILK